MVLKTEDYVVKHDKVNRALMERERMDNWFAFHDSQCKLIDDKELSINNWERQEGNKMSVEKFEKLLKNLNSNFWFENIDGSPLFKRLKFGDETILLYHNFTMPEYSWFNTKEEEVFDPSLLKRSPNPESLGHIDRRDVSDLKLKVHEDGSVSYELDSEAPRPGYRKIRIPWNEKVRGWRTVLRRLVEGRYCSIDQVERLVPSGSERAGWGQLKQSNVKSFM